MDESTAARSLSLKLTEVEYTGELSSQLLAHADLLEKHYKSLRKAVKNKVQDEGWYAKLYSILDERHTWFSTAESAASSILKGLAAKKKAKGKGGKAKKDVKATVKKAS